ncbi:MAG TPA: hypothetical protein VIK89_00930 [Cytophagaceae bacterium]
METELVKFWVEDGILMEVIKVPELDLQLAKTLVEERIKASAGVKMPMLVDIKSLKYVSKEARQYFAKHSKSEDVISVAILASNPVTLMGAKLYILIEKPIIKTEVFVNKKKAIQWLKRFGISESIPHVPTGKPEN